MITENGNKEFEFQGGKYNVTWKTINRGQYLMCQGEIKYWGVKNKQWNFLGKVEKNNMSGSNPAWINSLSNTPPVLKSAIKKELGVES